METVFLKNESHHCPPDIFLFDEVESLDGVKVHPGDVVELHDGRTETVQWVGIQQGSYWTLIGLRPRWEKSAVFFRSINRVIKQMERV